MRVEVAHVTRLEYDADVVEAVMDTRLGPLSDADQRVGSGWQSQSQSQSWGAASSPSRGGGASHAWVEAYTPTHGWRGFDPTNNLVADEHYVKVGVGRDYNDVPPTRGTYRGG